ncbi:ABC transporter ATP-binding protein [Fodinibius sediminis]|uniref:ABC-type multidrug transport system, ATPase component n=1 Tax=Fodinibius sediminis TaxID=1214077 RepID=A0A521DZW0_9BACT|nr:ABC transporter ATP-binding protein [Fodinibius sediminis]SMO77162.1 ABC-type multidrug transport system, ATPase component [Fodinibius sediminis]
MQPVRIHNLQKSYGGIQALRGITFDVQEGELFGLIGPDGAGKTTLFRIITTLLKPDSGEASVLGKDVVDEYNAIRSSIGYMPGQFALYQDLSVRENMNFFASVFGTTLEQNYELVAPIYRQLEPFENRLAGALSGGMKQKLALSCALIHKPALLVLDEPTTGVDAVSRKEFWQMLHRLKAKGITILVSTPYMDEAKQCDRIALMQNGGILSIESPSAVTRQFDRQVWSVRAGSKYRLIQFLRGYEHAESVQPFGESIHYIDYRAGFDPADFKQMLERNGFQGVQVQQVAPGIEDVFIRLMEQEETYE